MKAIKVTSAAGGWRFPSAFVAQWPAAAEFFRFSSTMRMRTRSIILVLVFSPSVAFTQLSLTYQIEGGWVGSSSSVLFAGTFSYDTSAEDQLTQLDAGRFGLRSWNVLVDVNNGQRVTLFTSENTGQGAVAASLTQMSGPPLLLFQSEEYAQFGVYLGLEDGNPNVPWIIPDGTLLTGGFVEGGNGYYPDDINDQIIPLNSGSRVTLIPEPSTIELLSFLLVLEISRKRRSGFEHDDGS